MYGTFGINSEPHAADYQSLLLGPLRVVRSTSMYVSLRYLRPNGARALGLED